MPRTWSNRKIEHIDLNPKKRGLPAAGWAVMVFGIGMLIIYTVLAVNVCLHPIGLPVNESMPANSSAPAAP